MRGTSLILTILIAIQIFWFSSLHGGSVNTGSNLVAIAYHFIIFFLFSFFLFFTIKGDKKIKAKYIFTTIFLSIIYAISDEVHQIFIPLRSASISDVLTDFAGILIATFFYIYISKKSESKRKDENHHLSFEEEYENIESNSQEEFDY